MRSVTSFCLFASLISTLVQAQFSRVPLVVQRPQQKAAQPRSAGFKASGPRRRVLTPGTGLNFANVVDYGSGGSGAYSVAVADVNGDGNPDIVVANECGINDCTSGDVAVLLGNGDGTFQTAVAYDSGGYQTRSVAVADVNRDGRPDLLVTSCCGDQGIVGVLLGNGDGTFQPVVTYDSGGSYPLTVAVADVNGDGNLDLVVANANSDAVGVLLGNGDGTFQAAVSYGSGGTDTNSVAVADVNGDGKPDLLAVNSCSSDNNCNGSVGVLLGNGDGTFQPVVPYDSGGSGAMSVAVADVNGDGKLDLICANDGTVGTVGVLLGNGDGTFQTPVTYNSDAGTVSS